MQLDWPTHYGDPSWFIHDRFGMFIHWGLYSLRAKDEWIMTQEKIAKEDYEPYLDQFEADLFEPKKWVEQAKRSGMKYIVLTTKHHEGFALWDSAYTNYKITNTPYGKDALQEFVDACREGNIKIGFYHSVIDWHHEHFTIDGLHPAREDETVKAEDRDMKIYQQYLYNQVEELVTNYGKIDYFWFDFSYDDREWDWAKGKGAADWRSEEIEKLILQHQPHMIINNRLGLNRGVYTPEQYQPTGMLTTPDNKKRVWEACQTFNDRWTYNPNNLHMKSAEMIVKLLIDTVSKDGNLLMNFGPTARGNFDEASTTVLEGISKWMTYHHQSIYGAGPSEIDTPQDCRLTQKGDRLYIHLFSWPFRTIHLEDFPYEINYARFLHDHSEVTVRRFNPEDAIHHDQPLIAENEVVFELPVIEPNHIVPVIEVGLGDKK